MPLIARLPAVHTIREFRAAAQLRYQEARPQALAGDRLAAIYLWGYATEMLLKAAYFRLRGWTLTQNITIADLNNARTYAIHQFGLAWPGNLHDLPRWHELLVEERRLQLVAYAPAFGRSLRARVRQVYLNRREHLRYRINFPYRGEVARVFQAVQWLLGQYYHL